MIQYLEIISVCNFQISNTQEAKQQYTVISYANNNVRVVETKIKEESSGEGIQQINRIDVVLNQINILLEELSSGNGRCNTLVTRRPNKIQHLSGRER